MTLSLDDVRNKRFRMARKGGYEVLEVDEFVDEVEVASRSSPRRTRPQEAGRGAEVARRPTASPQPSPPVRRPTGRRTRAAARPRPSWSPPAPRPAPPWSGWSAVDRAGRATWSARPPTRPTAIRDDANRDAQQVTEDARRGPTGSSRGPESTPSACRPRPRAAPRTSTPRSPAALRAVRRPGRRARRADQAPSARLRGFEASLPVQPERPPAAARSPRWSRAPLEPYEVPALAEESAIAAAEQRSTDGGGTATSRTAQAR